MDIKGYFSRNWLNFALIALGIIIIAMYFKPQFSGYAMNQHDTEQWRGMANETNMFRDETGKEPLWTDAAFGGMPTDQISVQYPGNWFKEIMNKYLELFPMPMGSILLHFLSFLLLARLLKMNAWVGFIGAIAFSFASYELIVLQAGHLTKSLAAAFLPAIIGGMIYAYREKRLWGIIITGIAMTFELAVNHVQVTYYFGFVMLFVGLALLIDAIRKKTIKSFAITTVGLFGVLGLAVLINIGNIAMTNDYAKQSIRSKNDVTITPDGAPATNQSEGLDKEYITNWSYGIGETFTLLSPYVKGNSSGPVALSPFTELVEKSDLSVEDMDGVMKSGTYWGEQPITSGPVYIGIIVCFLAFIGLFFVKDPLNWALLAASGLTIMLSWGKNFMGLTDFFIENVPLYDKFRAVTIILVVVEVTIPLMAMIAINELVKNREALIANKKKLYIAGGSFLLFLFILLGAGLGDNYSSLNERKQIAGANDMIYSQIMGMSNEQAAQYGFDKNNPAQVQQVVQMQVDNMNKSIQNTKKIREEIYSSSMTRSILFSLALAVILFLFVYMKTASTAKNLLYIGASFLVLFDMIPVARNYIGNEESKDSVMGKPIWMDEGEFLFPIAANAGDLMVLENETAMNPKLKAIVNQYASKGAQKADELGIVGIARDNVINAYRFYGLNKNTNYRVFDLTESPTNSSRASYFHKSIGGYHGAKLQNINNLFAFHLGSMNKNVIDMMNIKYMLQKITEDSIVAAPNTTAMGPAWFSKKIETYATPNDEIRALGAQFDMENKGTGQLLVNQTVQTKAHVYGTEKLQYLLPGKDTISLQMPNGLAEGLEAYMVIDINGRTNYIPAQFIDQDTTNSFTKVALLKTTKLFDPRLKTVMLSEQAAKLKKKQFTGEGSIKLLSYQPNKLVYQADAKGDQLAVFSEIYYPKGWSATIDGKPADILKVNYLLRGLSVPSGNHKIVFEYNVPKYEKTNTYAQLGSIAMFLLLFGGIGLEWRNRKKKAAETTNN